MKQSRPRLVCTTPRSPTITIRLLPSTTTTTTAANHGINLLQPLLLVCTLAAVLAGEEEEAVAEVMVEMASEHHIISIDSKVHAVLTTLSFISFYPESMLCLPRCSIFFLQSSCCAYYAALFFLFAAGICAVLTTLPSCSRFPFVLSLFFCYQSHKAYSKATLPKVLPRRFA